MLFPATTLCVEGDRVKEKSDVTVMMRVAGLGSVSPRLSVTVRDAVYVPGVEYVTEPGVAPDLELGLPPGNTQLYEATVPSGSLPVPANETDCPGPTATLPAGLVIVPVGAKSVGVADS